MPRPMGHGYVGDRRLHEASDSREMSSSEGNYEMRAVVQRVSQASVKVEEQIVGAIERGLLVLLGMASTTRRPTSTTWPKRSSAYASLKTRRGR